VRTVNPTDAGGLDRYYVEHTRVHSLLATDDEIRFPDGRAVDEDDGTMTLEEYRAAAV